MINQENLQVTENQKNQDLVDFKLSSERRIQKLEIQMADLKKKHAEQRHLKKKIIPRPETKVPHL